MSHDLKLIQLHCTECNTSIWIEVDLSEIAENGVIQNSIIHEGHVLTFELDRNGSVRSLNPIKIFQNYIEILSDDVARAFLDQNEKMYRWAKIDIYTSNQHLVEFFINILSKIVSRSLKNIGDEDITLASLASKEKILIRAAKFDILIGKELRTEDSGIPVDAIKGLILDITDAIKDKLVIEDVIKAQDWVVLLVPKDSRDPYFHAISSLCTELGIPYFIDSLSNENIRRMFDFINAVLQDS